MAELEIIEPENKGLVAGQSRIVEFGLKNNTPHIMQITQIIVTEPYVDTRLVNYTKMIEPMGEGNVEVLVNMPTRYNKRDADNKLIGVRLNFDIQYTLTVQ